MTKLKHTFKTDILFKILFTKHQHLLKILVSHLLQIPIDSIKEFIVNNPEIPPDVIRDKFSRLDIHMAVDDRNVNLEVQVENEGNFAERVLYYWAKIYSKALSAGGNYKDLPQTIVISIVDFSLFKDSKDYCSEFRLLEITRKTQLTDKQIFHFFELPKLPKTIDKNDLLKLWLALFNANTEEELQMIEELDVSEVNEAITAYRTVTASDELWEIERQRERARMNEAAALHSAEIRAEKRTEKRINKKWKGIVAEKKAEIAEKDTALAEKDALISELKAKLQAAEE